MILLNKEKLITNTVYFLLFFGFLAYQIIQIYLKGVDHIPSSIYLDTLKGLKDITVTTEPIYFIITNVLIFFGVPLVAILPIISQIIFGLLLYSFLIAAEPLSHEKKRIILLLTAFSFITIANSEAIIRQGIGMVFFTAFLFSERKTKWLHLILAILAHNVFAVVGIFYILLSEVLKGKINFKFLTSSFLLVFISLFIQKILNWLGHLTNRTGYLDYSTNSPFIDFNYNFLAALLFCGLIAGFNYLSQKNPEIKLISWKVLVLNFSVIVMQFAFAGFPFLDRLIYIPLIYLSFVICMFPLRPKFITYVGYALWILVNVIYMTSKTSQACEPYC